MVYVPPSLKISFKKGCVYYTLILPYAERINFAESNSTLAFGFNCWTGNDGTTADQLLNVDFLYHHWKLENNEYKRTITTLGSHFCTKEDFYNHLLHISNVHI